MGIYVDEIDPWKYLIKRFNRFQTLILNDLENNDKV